MKEKIKGLPKSVVLYLIFAVLMIIAISSKKNYYIDEIYSYGLSNYTGEGIDMEIAYNKTYTPGVSVFWDYLQVQDGERFDYQNVWENQAEDVHPPLYYAILHTICSIFSNRFSRWYAGSINIICALLVLAVIRKLITLLTEERYFREILSVSFIFMTGILHASTYFRMYVLAMLWVALLTYLFLKQVDIRHDIRFYVSVYLVTTAGALTHYYVIVYAVLLSFIYGCYLLFYEKRFRDTLFFCLVMAGAGVSSVAVFPAMIQHMFFEYRGEEAVDNFMHNSDYWENLKAFFNILDSQMFGKLLGILIISLVILSVIRFAQDYFGILEEHAAERISFDFEKKIILRYIMIFLPCFLYFMLISKIVFVTADRYIVPIYAVLFVGIMCCTYTVLRVFVHKKIFFLISVCMTAVMIVGSFTSSGWTYLYRDSRSFLAAAKEHSGYDCICVMADPTTYSLYTSFEEYSNYKSITFITLDDLEKNSIGQWAAPEGIVMSFFLRTYDAEKQLQNIIDNTDYTEYQFLGTFGFDNTYFVH